MFDIAYIISNCDYEYSSDEKKYLNVILRWRPRIAYLEIFKEVIMLDQSVHKNEEVLYKLLCEQWEQKSLYN
jgi:hypothetical protein